jgi:methionyl-tRNA synthetase
MGMSGKYFDFKVDSTHLLTYHQKEWDEVNAILAQAQNYVYNMQMNKYLEDIWKVLTIANKAIGDYEPWTKMKEGKTEEAMALVALITNIVAKVALLLDCVMPEKIKQVAHCLGIIINNATFENLIDNQNILQATNITKIDALFPRIENILLQQASPSQTSADTALQEVPKKESKKDETKSIEDDNLITIDQFFQTTLKIGKIVEAKEVEKSKKLLQLQVDLGEKQNRQILAGIKEFYSAQELVGTQVCVVANLKPAKLMGMLSEGMLLAAKDENGLCLIRPEKEKTIGTKIS